MRHGSMINPPNRFERLVHHADDSHKTGDPEIDGDDTRHIEYYIDASKSIVSENNSPDITFRYSINPYRGCVHACAYCYARPTHEYLGFNAGLDFETKIMVKPDAARLFREYLAKKNWEPDRIVFSGVTDCYQPIERKLELTRQCLIVAREHGVPIGIVTKNALVTRDLDILQDLAKRQLAEVYLSINTLEVELSRAMEPRTSSPEARLGAVKKLADAGVPVGVLVSPMIPGLNDSDMPTVMEAAKQAGAWNARYTLLRLPLTVEPVFLEWLERTQPNHVQKVLQRIRQSRDGQLNNSQFGERMRGSGPIAEQIHAMFKLFQKKLELDRPMPSPNLRVFARQNLPNVPASLPTTCHCLMGLTRVDVLCQVSPDRCVTTG